MNIKVVGKGVVSLLTKRFMGPFWFRRKWLAKTQWFSADQLRDLQLDLLKQLISHVYDSVPYYRSFMKKEKMVTGDICSLEDIQKFPIMSKEDVHKAGRELVSTKFRKFLLHTAYTGGTTGPRLPLWRDFGSIGNEHAFVRRQFDWAGIGIRDRCAYMTWRTVTSPNTMNKEPYVYDPLMRELILSTFHLSADMADIYVDAMERYKVKALLAYPSAALVLARELLIKGRRLPLRSVLTTSETLGPIEKEQICQAFQCPVYDFYGSAERVCYINTCEKLFYHIVPEYGLTELIPAAAPNEGCCRIIATGFWSLAMPLIRYDTGDMVIPAYQPCECGRAFEVVERIVGRENKSIITASGRNIGLTAMARLLKNVLLRTNKLPICQSQVLLEDSGAVCFEYVPSKDFKQEDLNILNEILQQELPEDLQMKINSVEKITRTISGKAISLAKG
jgi:phenylacetate-CoA ligase